MIYNILFLIVEYLHIVINDEIRRAEIENSRVYISISITMSNWKKNWTMHKKDAERIIIGKKEIKYKNYYQVLLNFIKNTKNVVNFSILIFSKRINE